MVRSKKFKRRKVAPKQYAPAMDARGVSTIYQQQALKGQRKITPLNTAFSWINGVFTSCIFFGFFMAAVQLAFQTYFYARYRVWIAYSTLDILSDFSIVDPNKLNHNLHSVLELASVGVSLMFAGAIGTGLLNFLLAKGSR